MWQTLITPHLHGSCRSSVSFGGCDSVCAQCQSHAFLTLTSYVGGVRERKVGVVQSVSHMPYLLMWVGLERKVGVVQSVSHMPYLLMWVGLERKVGVVQSVLMSVTKQVFPGLPLTYLNFINLASSKYKWILLQLEMHPCFKTS
jgi:hypothetical protein